MDNDNLQVRICVQTKSGESYNSMRMPLGDERIYVSAIINPGPGFVSFPTDTGMVYVAKDSIEVLRTVTYDMSHTKEG